MLYGSFSDIGAHQDFQIPEFVMPELLLKELCSIYVIWSIEIKVLSAERYLYNTLCPSSRQSITLLSKIQGHAIIIKQLWSKFLLVSNFLTEWNPATNGMESPGHTYSHILIFSFWHFVEADFKKYRLVFYYSIDQQNSTKKIRLHHRNVLIEGFPLH